MKLKPTEEIEAIIGRTNRECEPLLFLIICDDEQYPTRQYSIYKYTKDEKNIVPSTWECTKTHSRHTV